MEKGSVSGLMTENMKENGQKACQTEKEFTTTRMEIGQKENGKTIKLMERLCFWIQMGEEKRECMRKDKEEIDLIKSLNIHDY